MNRGFQVDRYGEFLGRVPDDIFNRVPPEERTTFLRELAKQAHGKAVIGWQMNEEGWPIPILRSLQISAKGTF